MFEVYRNLHVREPKYDLASPRQVPKRRFYGVAAKCYYSSRRGGSDSNALQWWMSHKHHPKSREVDCERREIVKCFVVTFAQGGENPTFTDSFKSDLSNKSTIMEHLKILLRNRKIWILSFNQARPIQILYGKFWKCWGKVVSWSTPSNFLLELMTIALGRRYLQ